MLQATFQVEAGARSRETLILFLKKAISVLDLVDYDIVPYVNLSRALRFARKSAGILALEEKDGLWDLPIAKLEEIISESSEAEISFLVFFPMKFNKTVCERELAKRDIPAFYTEDVSGKLPAEHRQMRQERK